jgi:uncharacterized membrane protein
MKVPRNDSANPPAGTRAPASVEAEAPVRSTWNMLVWNHSKLWMALAVGIAVVLASPTHWGMIGRILSGWNGALLVLLPLTYFKLRRLDSRQLRDHYEEEDPTAPVIMIVVVTAAILSLIAIVSLLSTLKQVQPPERAAHLALATLTIANSWAIVHTMFAIHYADMYYSVAADELPPLEYPHTREPLFWDFLYFAFTIGAACQTSDIMTTQTHMRRVVTIHSVIAFGFNVAVLGFAINVSASLLGQG